MTEQIEILDKPINMEESFELNSDLKSMIGVYWDSDKNYSNVTPSTIKQWLVNPMNYGEEIRMVSRWLYNQNGIYTNVIDYMTALPTLDYVLYGTNQSKIHSKFSKNKSKYGEALRLMRHKQIVRDMIMKLAIDGVYFGYLETTEAPDYGSTISNLEVWNIIQLNEKEGSLQEVEDNAAHAFNASIFALPTEWCKIVGMKNSSYVIAFDLFYFDTLTSNGRSMKLMRYPKEIRDKYREYRQSPDVNKRWAILDYTKTVTLKVRANREEITGRPLGLAAFTDMLFSSYFTDSKRQTLDEINNAVIYQTFPEGESKGQSSLTQKQQKGQHDNIKSALFTKSQGQRGISFFSLAAGTKLEKLEVDAKLLETGLEDELIKRIATDLGFAGAALNGEGGTFSSTESNIELVASEVMSWLEQIADEFNKVINLNIIKDTSCYVQLYYMPTTIANRDKMVGYMKDLYVLGKGSLQAWIASTGINPDAYIALMDEELANKFDEKYPVHQTAYTSTDETNPKDPTNKGGRPTAPNPSASTKKKKTYTK